MRLETMLLCAALSSAQSLAQSVSIHTVARGLSYPVAVATGPVNAQGHATVYVASRLGTVRLVDTVTGVVGTGGGTPVLTAGQPVYVGGDAGLQCVAVGPLLSGQRTMYVYYNTSATVAVLERQLLNAEGTQAVAGSAQTVLRYARSAGHNGGWLGFSPVDGLLYLSLGDGGFANDPDPTNAAQALSGPNVFQGKVLRLDPSGDDFPADPDRNYRVPPGNPFVNAAGDDEIWDYGLRNPWRCAFDPVNGDFWIADVGQETWEEVNVERAGTPSALGGHNYGWKCFEGPLFTGYTPCVSSMPFTQPAFIYGHDEAGGCSITGGVVYRGGAFASLGGSYLYSDYCNPTVWALTDVGGTLVRSVLVPAGTVTPEGDAATSVVAFGTDLHGEVYYVDLFAGLLLKLDATACSADLGQAGGEAGADGLLDNNDFIAFINYFFEADTRADVGAAGGEPGLDGLFDNNDFIVFIDRFFDGC